MYYELYVDILYLVNFMMDFLILLLVKKILKCKSSYLRIFLASSIGAFLSCVVIVLPIKSKIIEFLIFHLLINSIMLVVGFVISDIRLFVKCLISLYVSSVLLGGTFLWLSQYLKIASLFFFVAVMSYGIVSGIWWFISSLHGDKEKWFDVEIHVNNQAIQVKALLDTGNSLYDPISGKPVSVIEKALLESVMKSKHQGNEIDEIMEYKGRYISFHSLGNSGTMLAICVDRLHICGTKEYWVEKPLIALSEETISVNGDYGMILNPGIL